MEQENQETASIAEEKVRVGLREMRDRRALWVWKDETPILAIEITPEKEEWGAVVVAAVYESADT